MSEGTQMTDMHIEINDLPPEETLTPEEKERLAGAGRYRPTFEALEARYMMDAGIGGGLTAPMAWTGGASTAQTADFQILDATAPSGPVQFGQYGTDGKVVGGVSDASAALPMADGIHVWVGDDKSDFIRLYNSQTGQLIKSIDFTKVLRNEGETASSDIEGVARVGDTAYWIGSGGKWGSNIILATTVKDDGANSDLTFLGTRKLQGAIYDWGVAHPDFKVTTDGSTEITLAQAIDKANTDDVNAYDKSWYNIEGIVGKDSTAYIAFRAPLVKADDGKLQAFLLPVTNFNNNLFLEKGTPGRTDPTFGDPILFDLTSKDGAYRGFRDIVYHQDWNKFLMLGGLSGENGNVTTFLYIWDGTHSLGADGQEHGKAFELYTAGVQAPDGRWMSFEAIGQIAGTLADLENGRATVQLLADDGGSPHGKDQKVYNYTDHIYTNRYFWGQFFTISKEDGTTALAGMTV